MDGGNFSQLLRRFVHPDDLEDLRRKIEENRVHPDPAHPEEYEHRAIRRDGEVIHILARKRVITDAQGRPIMAIGVNQDITTRKKTEEQLVIAGFAMQSSISAIGLADLAGKVTFVNDSWLKLWGYDNVEDVLGRPISGFLAEGDQSAGVQSLRSGRVYVGEDIAVRKNGTLFHVYYAINPVHSPDGKPVCMMASMVDISDRKLAEERLRESEERHRFFFDSVSDAIFVHPLTEEGLPGTFIEVNSAASGLFGWDREELLRMTPADVSIPEGRASIVPMMKRLQTEKRTVREGIHMTKGGKRIPVEVNLHAFSFRGKPTVLAAVRDITARKAAEKAVRESEAKFRSYVEYSPVAVIVTDHEGRIIDVNRSAVDLLGYDAVTLGRMNLWDVHLGDDREQAMNDFATLMREGRIRVESRFQRQDGSLVWVSLHAVSIGNDLFLSYCSDITDKKHAQELMRRYELLSGNTRDIILFMTREGDILEANAAAEKAYGYGREELSGLSIRDLRADETSGFTEEQMTEADGNGILFETVHRRKDGTVFPVEVSSRGALIGGTRTLISVVRDITERKAAEEALRTTAARLVRAEEISRTGNWELNLSSQIIRGSQGASRIYGLAGFEWPLASIQGIPLPEYRETLDMALSRLIGEDVPYDVEYRIRHAGNGTRVDVHSVAEYDRERDTVFGVIQDVTERRRLEEQLLQAQKMEAIGTLAGGVAHDFNNILTVIMGLGNIIQMTVGPDDRIKPHVDQIVLSSERAADLTQSLLAFSRKQRIVLEPHKVSDVVASTAKLLKRLLPEDIELTLDLADREAAALLDVAQIDQVLMNLATNARDAMLHGGSLTIKTGVATLNKTFKNTHGFGKPGTYVRISVSDTGIGMDERTMERIFDPFFTTKDVGKGTGLGLASVYGIVKQHNGYTTVASVLFKGTTFDIYLPLVDMKVQTTTVSDVKIEEGSETILVIEDDTDVRKMITTILSGRGYTALDAADGDGAVEVFNSHKDTIDLVILDVVMPGRNGKEVLDEIIRIKPGVRAIFMSGYTGDIVIDKGVQKDGVDFLRKPLSVASLLAKVREVLDR